MNADHGQIEKHIQEIIESVGDSLDTLRNFRRGTKGFEMVMGCASGLVEALNILGCRFHIDYDSENYYYLDMEKDI